LSKLVNDLLDVGLEVGQESIGSRRILRKLVLDDQDGILDILNNILDPIRDLIHELLARLELVQFFIAVDDKLQNDGRAQIVTLTVFDLTVEIHDLLL
jgi:hypothetical protein